MLTEAVLGKMCVKETWQNVHKGDMIISISVILVLGTKLAFFLAVYLESNFLVLSFQFESNGLVLFKKLWGSWGGGVLTQADPFDPRVY